MLGLLVGFLVVGILKKQMNESLQGLNLRVLNRAACDSHAHLVSKDSFVISRKSPSPVFKWSGI